MILLLKNLVANALRYSRPSDGPVALNFDTSGVGLYIEVRDHGPGFSAEQALHFGEPFHRGDPSRTRDTGGTGLGPFLAIQVARAHGGTLQLQLQQGTRPGACLRVELPQA